MVDHSHRTDGIWNKNIVFPMMHEQWRGYFRLHIGFPHSMAAPFHKLQLGNTDCDAHPLRTIPSENNNGRQKQSASQSQSTTFISNATLQPIYRSSFKTTMSINQSTPAWFSHQPSNVCRRFKYKNTRWIHTASLVMAINKSLLLEDQAINNQQQPSIAPHLSGCGRIDVYLNVRSGKLPIRRLTQRFAI